MWTDVVDLRDFYASPLGRVARRMIRRQLRQVWPDVSGLRVLGLGFATPFLRPFVTEAERVVAAMPAAQGVLHWPPDERGLTVLADETELPFEDVGMDRVLLVHALENAEAVRPMLREVWRVLAGGGRFLVVVPNRGGVWSRLDRTPFGHGRPYSARQLSTLLRENMFTPIETRTALFVPPLKSRMVLSSSPAWENVGARAFSHFGGVVMVEATKQIYAGHPEARVARRRRYVILPQGPQGNPVRSGHRAVRGSGVDVRQISCRYVVDAM